MTTKATIPDGEWSGKIPDFARCIGEAARARRVVLFGSAARGEMGKRSDLDFLVVIPDGQHRREAQRRARRALRGNFREPRPGVDVVARTENDVRELRDCPFSIIKSALDEGVEVWRAENVG